MFKHSLADQVTASEHTGGTSVWSAANQARDAGISLDDAMTVLLPAYEAREPTREGKAAQRATGIAQITKAYGQPAGPRPRRDFVAETAAERLLLAATDPAGEVDAVVPVTDGERSTTFGTTRSERTFDSSSERSTVNHGRAKAGLPRLASALMPRWTLSVSLSVQP